MTEAAEVATRLDDPAEALLALYRQPPLDNLKAPGFGRADVATLPGSVLLERAALGELMARYTASFGEGADRKAAASIWSKYFFSLVSIPTLVANLLLGRELPVRPEQLRLELGGEAPSRVRRLC
ncbi:hypothetical protein [Billgrantia endophytica]|uniref:hypothetical protein n=1 Tax=Billgrantia endophytica TaxID=2033802 RepID=UPI001F0C4673|nr:hypothetical protein [Halomonas endophytica]